MRKNAKLKEKQKWSNEKLHLENARKLRGIYFIDPEDMEFKSKIMKIVGVLHPIKMRTRLACILEADESKRLCMGESLPNHHEDHISGKKETIHYSITIWFTNLFPCLKPQNSSSESSSGQRMEKLEKFSAWTLTKVRSKKR